MIKESTGEKIIETIQTFPLEDPIQLLGFNVNQIHTSSYGRSKLIMNMSRKCDDDVKEQENLILDGLDIENRFLTQREESSIEIALKKYSENMSQRVIKSHEKCIRLLEYSKNRHSLKLFFKLINSPCFEERSS